jgi:hypothetical protein
MLFERTAGVGSKIRILGQLACSKKYLRETMDIAHLGKGQCPKTDRLSKMNTGGASNKLSFLLFPLSTFLFVPKSPHQRISFWLIKRVDIRDLLIKKSI